MKRRFGLFACAASAVLLLTSAAYCGVHLKSGSVGLPSAPQAAAQGPGRGYYIVQLTGPVTSQHKQCLADWGADIVEYVPDNAFVVRLPRSSAASPKKPDCVQWVAPFKPEYKRAGPKLSGGRRGQFIVRLFPGESVEYVRGKAGLLGAKIIGRAQNPKGAVLRVLADESQLAGLAKLGAVAWIEPYVQPRLCNDAAAAISRIPQVRQQLALYGAGQTVGVADAGLDTGDLGTISADFAGRVLKTYALRRPGDWSDLNGHGSHVVGSLLGSGVLSGSNPPTHTYDGSFAGYAPEAGLVFQSIGDEGSYVFPPLHLGELFQPVYDDGARVHSDSWGSAVAGEYTVYSSEVDQFCWDHKDFTLVYAVGNEAEDIDQDGVVDLDNLYAPATAKNCIAVGASENLRATGGYQIGYGVAWPSSYPVPPIKYNLMSDDSTGMAAFSGRGPTNDGRIKPDICAPGTNVLSCRSHIAGSSTGWGVYNADYIYWGGTSMSTPQVAGAAALVREYYLREKGSAPTAALVKAALINGAADIAPGQYGTGQYQELQPVPDPSQGWGRLNVKQSLFPDPPAVNEFIDESASLATGAFREYQCSVLDNSTPFKATLVWTDYPGAVHAATELVNDLDLSVTAPSGGPPIISGDHTNNVEQIKVDVPEVGTYTVRVTGYNVPMGPQDYALVVSGGLPTTYIAGRVTSTSGAAVQGVLVSFVSTGGTKRVTTNPSGQYISHVAPGLYSVQVSKPGWTFNPSKQTVTVVDTPVEDVDFQGQGSPGSASGAITSAVGGIVSHVVESPHPYLNNMDQVYTITAHQDATRVRVHFAEIDLMNDGDTILVLDGTDNIKDTFTGRGEDIWSSWADGAVIKIRLQTNDFGNIGYGFYVDGYETDLIEQGGLGGAMVTLSPGGYQAASAPDGTYGFASVPPGTYTFTPSMPHWKFQPPSKNIEIPAGGSAPGVDFLAFPPGSITGQVRISSSETHAVNVESPHPYPSNYEQTWQIDADPSTTRMRLHFAQLTTEPAWDFVYIMDGLDNIIEIYTADYTDLWTPWIPGSTARIMLTSDDGNNDYGFRCDRYEAVALGAGLAGVRIDLSPDSRTVYTSQDGLFGFSDVDVGTHTVTPSGEPWVFDPSPVQVSISPAVTQSLFFYASMGEITQLAQARSVPDGVQVTVPNVVVSAVFNGFFYVQDPDRACGLRVVSSAAVSLGDVVDITGQMATVEGERRINATSVVVK